MRSIILAVAIGLLGVGCTSVEDEPTETVAESAATVTGTVSYRERIMLRPGTVVEVSLLDTSRADAPAIELAKQVIEDPGAPPIPFVLEYDPGKIDERFSYSVRATITRGERLLFTTDTNYPVLTRGAGNAVDLMLVAPASRPDTPDAPLDNTYWKLSMIGNDAYEHATKQREPHIKFNKTEGRVSGFTGCNDLNGGYSVEDQKLEFGQIAVTMKACIDGMDTEQLFLQALRQVGRYEISGDTLRLLEGDTPLLEFEAVYLQ